MSPLVCSYACYPHTLTLTTIIAVVIIIIFVIVTVSSLIAMSSGKPRSSGFFCRSTNYSRTSIKLPPFKRPPSIKRPFFKVPNYFGVSELQYSIPLLNSQPLLSGQFSKSRKWPLNGGPTVSRSSHCFFLRNVILSENMLFLMVNTNNKTNVL